MRSKRKLFKLLALREKVERNKFFNQAKSIASEMEKNNALNSQLKEITANKKVNGETLTALQLRSDKWYDFQIQEQILATENRAKFLKEENQQVNRKIAIQNKKLRKSLEKVQIERKLELADLEKKTILSAPTNANKRQGFNS